MIDPLVALLVFAGAVAGVAVVLWPERGLWARWRDRSRRDHRVLLEDALKHLYASDEEGRPATVHSLAGALGLGGPRAAELIGRLQDLGLARSEAGAYRLTGAGRRDAAQVIRTHRLIESHLSRTTGAGAERWHREADRREHDLSADEVDALASRLGHPRFDPHGDPIPTAAGEVRERRGEPLDDLAAGETGRVVHVEDEPEAVFARLARAGVAPGLDLEVVESSGGRVEFVADGERHELPAVVAANVTVDREAPAEADRTSRRLSSLGPGERATMRGFVAACRPEERRRFLDLGLIPGTEVTAELEAPGGDPTAYRIRGAVIGLRRRQAEMIRVRAADRGATT